MGLSTERNQPRVDRRGGLARDLLADDRADQRTKAVGVGLEAARADAVDDRPQVRVDPAQVPHSGGPAIAGAAMWRRRSGLLRGTRGMLAVSIHFSKPFAFSESGEMVGTNYVLDSPADSGTHVLDPKSLAHSLLAGNTDDDLDSEEGQGRESDRNRSAGGSEIVRSANGAFWRFLALLRKAPSPIFKAKQELGPTPEIVGTFRSSADQIGIRARRWALFATACTDVSPIKIREDLPDASASKTSKSPFCRFWRFWRRPHACVRDSPACADC